MSELFSTRLSDPVAEALCEKVLDDTHQPALRAAHRLHQVFDPYTASELVEDYIRDEAEKLLKASR
jgi:hypothetical protein